MKMHELIEGQMEYTRKTLEASCAHQKNGHVYDLYRTTTIFQKLKERYPASDACLFMIYEWYMKCIREFDAHFELQNEGMYFYFTLIDANGMFWFKVEEYGGKLFIADFRDHSQELVNDMDIVNIAILLAQNTPHSEL